MVHHLLANIRGQKSSSSNDKVKLKYMFSKRRLSTDNPSENVILHSDTMYHSVLVSVSCPKAVYHLESDNLFRITVVVADWLG